MPILVTGANGHLGCLLVRELVRRGREPIAFVRPGSDLTGLEGLAVERRLGDVRDAASVSAAATGCDAIVHLAAVYALRAARAEEIMEPAVAGTTHVLAAAATHGVRRVVMTSSIVAVGYNRSPQAPPRTEEDWNEEPHIPYVRAKTESERLAWKLAGERGVELVTVLPGAILGPHDYRVTPSTRFVRDLANGRGMTGRGGVAYVDVGDVALAHAEALERGVAGERYIVAGPCEELRRIGELVGERVGKRPAHVGAPRWLALPTVAVQSALQRLVGIEPFALLGEAREFVGRWPRFDTSKAQKDLGFTPRPLPEILGDTLRWLAERGELKPAVKERVLARRAAA
jgi:dihydroflavonol-4-reductase